MGSVLEAPDSFPHLSDQELALRLREYPDDRAVLESLAQRCRHKLAKIVRYCVFVKTMCPSDTAPETFAAEMIGEAAAQLISQIRTLREPEHIYSWLRKIAINVILDALRKTKGRSKVGPRKYEPLMSSSGERDEADALDSKRARDAARMYGALSLGPNPEETTITGDIVEKIIRKHGLSGKKRDLDSAIYFQLVCRKQATFEEVAALRGTSTADAYHLIGHDEKAMAEIAKRDFGINNSGDI